MKFLFITAMVLAIATSVLAQGQLVVEGWDVQTGVQTAVVDLQPIPINSATVVSYGVSASVSGVDDLSIGSFLMPLTPVMVTSSSTVPSDQFQSALVIQPVPEPSTFVLGSLAFGTIIFARFCKTQTHKSARS